jgi:hypothetical protein
MYGYTMVSGLKQFVNKIISRLIGLLSGRKRLESLSNAFSPDPGELQSAAHAKLNTIRCQAQLREKMLAISIQGIINAPAPRQGIVMRIELQDVTVPAQPVDVRSSDEQHGGPKAAFILDQYKGRLPAATTRIEDWLDAASIDIESLRFAEKGRRAIQCRVSVLTADKRTVLAFGTGQIQLENEKQGYIEIERNEIQARRLGVTLALHIASVNAPANEEQVEIIKRWTAKIPGESAGNEAQVIEKALRDAVKFFARGGKVNAWALCEQIRNLSEPPTRLEILALCMQVACVKETEWSLEETNRCACKLEPDIAQYLSELEHETADLAAHSIRDDVLLGLFDGMEPEAACGVLKCQYSRWNARVTSFDQNLRNRAVGMINSITRLRGQYSLQTATS